MSVIIFFQYHRVKWLKKKADPLVQGAAENVLRTTTIDLCVQLEIFVAFLLE